MPVEYGNSKDRLPAPCTSFYNSLPNQRIRCTFRIMSQCLEPNDLAEIMRSDISESSERIRGIPADMCAPFNEEAGKLELQLLGVYKLTVICVKKELEMEKVVKWWQFMKATCDEYLAQIGRLHKDHPYCGADFFYDRVLEVRSKCERMMTLHG